MNTNDNIGTSIIFWIFIIIIKTEALLKLQNEHYKWISRPCQM